MINFPMILLPYSIERHQFIAKRLKEIRLAMGVSQETLGKYVGVTRQTIRNIEDGKAALRKPLCIALCAIMDFECATNLTFRITLEEMLTEEGLL